MISAFPETGSNHVKQSRGKTSSPGLLQQLRLRPPASAKAPPQGLLLFRSGTGPLRESAFGGGWGALGEGTPFGHWSKGVPSPQKRTPRAWHGAFALAYCPKNIMTATWRKAPHHPRARCCPHHTPAGTCGPAAGRVPFPRSCGSGPWRPCARSRRAG